MTNDDSDTHGMDEEPAKDLRLRDGDILRFPVVQAETHGGHAPLTVQWEIEIAGDSRSQAFGQQQAAVIQDVLTYLANKQPRPTEHDHE